MSENADLENVRRYRTIASLYVRPQHSVLRKDGRSWHKPMNTSVSR
ncbi:hypothetical protein GGQ85_004376 [Nitrobacter vulgaris]|nr:hypothetical protein [Nitrobacter vulgaris]